MSIKGFPTSQKLINDSQPSRHEFATVQPQDEALRFAMDVHARFAFRVDDATVPRTAAANTGNPSDGSGTVVFDTATPARVGDFVKFVTGQAVNLELPIVSVSTNSFKLGAKLASTLVPAAGDTFFIMRYATQLVDENGQQLVVATPGPSQFVLNSVDTEVQKDTGTPANTRAFPTELILNGETAQGQQTMADSLPVVISSNQTAVPVSGPLTDAELRATAVPVSGPLTDAQLRATAVPVSGPLTDAELRATAVPVSGPLTDAQLRATAVPVSAASLPLPTGAATEATLQGVEAQLIDLASAASTNGGGNAPTALQVLGSDGSAARYLKTDADGHLQVDVLSQASNAGGENTDSTVSTVATLTAPANALGFILMNLDTSSANIRWRIGAVATASAGQQLQAGRDTGYIPCAANISICAESGTQNYNIQWILSQ